jgi:hypothetical protein
MTDPFGQVRSRQLAVMVAVTANLAYMWKSQGQDKGATAWMRRTGRLQKEAH